MEDLFGDPSLGAADLDSFRPNDPPQATDPEADRVREWGNAGSNAGCFVHDVTGADESKRIPLAELGQSAGQGAAHLVNLFSGFLG
jgi:hypothetical protein